MSLRLGPDTHPWIVTPCTYEVGVKASFYMRLFAKPSDLSHIHFKEVHSKADYKSSLLADFQKVDYAPYIRHINGEPEPAPAPASKATSEPIPATPEPTTPAEPEPQPEPVKTAEPEPVKAAEPAAPQVIEPEPPKAAEQPTKASESKKPKKEKKEKKKKEKKPSAPVKVCPEEVKCPGCGMVFDPYNGMVIAHPMKPIVAHAPEPPTQPVKGT